MLRARDLTFTYPEAEAPTLRAINLTAEPGQILAIVGESGSGKSTLGHLLCGALEPQGGEIQRGYEGRAALILQTPALNPMLRIQTQLTAVIRRHEPERDPRARAAELLALVDLEPALLRAYPHQLSGGMQQRVVIAMALVGRLGLLIADEPTSALDSLTARGLLELLRRLKGETRATIILITHRLKHAAWIADAVAVMHAGRLSRAQEAGAFFEAPEDPHGRALLEAAEALSRWG